MMQKHWVRKEDKDHEIIKVGEMAQLLRALTVLTEDLS